MAKPGLEGRSAPKHSQLHKEQLYLRTAVSCRLFICFLPLDSATARKVPDADLLQIMGFSSASTTIRQRLRIDPFGADIAKVHEETQAILAGQSASGSGGSQNQMQKQQPRANQ